MAVTSKVHKLLAEGQSEREAAFSQAVNQLTN